MDIQPGTGDILVAPGEMKEGWVFMDIQPGTGDILVASRGNEGMKEGWIFIDIQPGKGDILVAPGEMKEDWIWMDIQPGTGDILVARGKRTKRAPPRISNPRETVREQRFNKANGMFRTERRSPLTKRNQIKMNKKSYK